MCIRLLVSMPAHKFEHVCVNKMMCTRLLASMPVHKQSKHAASLCTMCVCWLQATESTEIICTSAADWIG